MPLPQRSVKSVVVAVAFFMHRNNERNLACAAALALFLMAVPLRSFAAQFTSKDYPVGLQPHLDLVYDFNGDGKPDIAVLNLGGTSSTTGEGSVSILLGNGNGTFQAAKNFDVGGVNPTTFAVADFNGDGKLDLAIGGLQAPVQPACEASIVNVLFGNGDGTFQPPQQAVTANLLSNYVTAGDVNGDGKADLVLYKYFGNQCQADGFSVFLGNGDGTFQSEQQIPNNPFDVNGDGIRDLVLIGSTLQIFLGQGNGVYKPLETGPEANVGFLLVGDLNNDQKQDQVFFDFACQGHFCPVGGSSYVATALGNGNGTFQPAKIFPPGGYPYPAIIRDIGLADFNGDGKLDIAVSGGKGSIIDVLLGKGDGTLPSLLSFDPGSGEDSFLVADLNGDGKPDIITANLNDQTISVMLNTFPSRGADLAVKAAPSSSLLSVTQNLIYTTSVSNYGPQDATNVVLTDTLPSTVNFTSVTSNQGTCTEAQLVVTCDMSTLVSGDSLVATITVVPTATGSITNTADATASENDANTGNNIASISTRVDPMWTLTVNFTGNGTGTVTMVSAQGSPLPYPGGVVTCTSTCSLTLPTGTQVQFTPSPDANMGFGGWTGACSGSIGSQCNVSMFSDQTAIVEFDTLPNFVFGLNFINIVVQQGGTDTETVNIYPQGQSFTSAIALTCTVQGASPAPPCSLSPTSVTLPDPNGATSTLTVTTIGSIAALGSPVGRPVFYAFALPLFGIVFIGIRLRPRQTRNNRLQLLFVGALLAAFSTQVACGGGSNNRSSQAGGGTPRGNYTVTITGTSGAIQHSTSVTLTVQ
jgi:uncharacterized repeat protein (TIGR01451 family)